MEKVFEQEDILGKDSIVEACNIYLNMTGHKKKRVYLCVGYPYRGDALGPMVGTLLEEYFKDTTDISIIGTIDNPVTAQNISDVVKEIDKDAEVVCIDAAYGIVGTGYVKIVDHGIKPGLAFGDNIGKIGDVSLMGAIYDVNKYDKESIENQAVFISHTIIRAERMRGEI